MINRDLAMTACNLLVIYWNNHYHLVHPEVINAGVELKGLCKADFYEGVTEDANTFLLLADMPWNADAITKWRRNTGLVINAGMKGWIEMEKGHDGYVAISQPQIRANPIWTKRSIEDLLESAFSGRVINLTHALCTRARYISDEILED